VTPSPALIALLLSCGAFPSSIESVRRSIPSTQSERRLRRSETLAYDAPSSTGPHHVWRQSIGLEGRPAPGFNGTPDVKLGGLVVCPAIRILLRGLPLSWVLLRAASLRKWSLPRLAVTEPPLRPKMLAADAWNPVEGERDSALKPNEFAKRSQQVICYQRTSYSFCGAGDAQVPERRIPDTSIVL
jgi:hypothetical protein